MYFSSVLTATLLAVSALASPLAIPRNTSMALASRDSTIQETQMMAGWKNITLGTGWPDNIPGPADMYREAVKELCRTLTCRESATSTPITTQIRIEDPTMPGRYILRPAEIWATATGWTTGQDSLDALAELIDQAARKLSWWTEEDYVVVDTVGATKEGTQLYREYNHRNWFVKTPNMLMVQSVNHDKTAVYQKLQVELQGKFVDDGMGFVCKVVTDLLGALVEELVTGGGFIVNTLGSTFADSACAESNQLPEN